MRIYTSLIWKEWHEVRAYLWIALGIFLGLPLIGAAEQHLQYGNRFDVLTTPWVTGFGGVLAIFVAVGATCRDFNGNLENFWQSRPISGALWLIAKYFIGVAVVLTGCALPIVVQSTLNRDDDVMWLLYSLPFLWVALYSVGFLCGCLVRRTAHAAMLALAMMLLFYLLPMLLAPMRWLSVLPVMFYLSRTTTGLETGYFSLQFAVIMLVISIASLALSVIAVRWSWRIEANRKAMYGCIATAILLIVGSSAFQFGTNLPILSRVVLPEGDFVRKIAFENGHGYVLINHSPTTQEPLWGSYLRSIDINSNSIKLGPPVSMSAYRYNYPALQVPGHPQLFYFVMAVEGTDQQVVSSLYLGDLTTDSDKEICQLWNHQDVPPPTLLILNDRLCVIGSRFLCFDIKDPVSPVLVKDVPFELERDRCVQNRVLFELDQRYHAKFVINLLPLPNFSPRQRLAATLKVLNPIATSALAGDTLYSYLLAHREAFHLASLTPLTATFEKIGDYQSSLLARVFGEPIAATLSVNGDLMYESNPELPGSILYSYRSHNYLTHSRINIFDISSPDSPRLVGHFAAPAEPAWAIQPLPDGRTFIAGHTLYLVGPPPRYENR